MQTSKTSTNNAVYCLLVFMTLLASMLCIALVVEIFSHTLFHIALFATGWISWTFFEYILHRFIMHTKKEKPFVDFRHTYHHTHPAEINITGMLRLVLFIGCIVLIALSVMFDNYFTIAAGFLCGFPVYAIMHFILHQQFSRKILPKMVRYHIYHHCKYPDKCFGISATWWDELFGTVPQQPPQISQRTINFYFKGQPH